ncbi:MAG: hypothetical protein M1484_03125 [Patescibacteria group bacterium]|nr:hypothetical protein [Patescibacteria group bacterium]MCL5432055.1 hypothetical protein [Patescibacteria group bacterium]
MKKVLPIIFAFFLLAAPVRADYNSAYNDYTYAYGQYRTAYNAYLVSKSTYLTYNTLTSQNDAIEKLRAVLSARDQVMFVYYDLLQEKINATASIPDDYKNTFAGIKQSEKDWLAANQTKIAAAASLDDLNSVSAEFASRYPQMDTETKQIIGTVYAAKEQTLNTQLTDWITSLNAKLAQMRADGQSTTLADRGLLNTKSKLDLFSQKMIEANGVFTTKNSDGIDLFKGQQTYSQANQYLREAAGFLTEIIKSITG